MSRDFASVLDDLLKSAAPVEQAPRPSIPFSITPPLDPLDAFWSSVSSEFVAGLYGETGGGAVQDMKTRELPPVDAAAIAAELDLDRAPKNLDRLRRAFAFKNHPDRVAPELRDRAEIRMQVANRLIDEAKRNRSGKARA